jgi:hypothetical protein
MQWIESPWVFVIDPKLLIWELKHTKLQSGYWEDQFTLFQSGSPKNENERSQGISSYG